MDKNFNFKEFVKKDLLVVSILFFSLFTMLIIVVFMWALAFYDPLKGRIDLFFPFLVTLFSVIDSWAFIFFIFFIFALAYSRYCWRNYCYKVGIFLNEFLGDYKCKHKHSKINNN